MIFQTKQKSSSLYCFKRLLNGELRRVPDHYLLGERKYQIYHTRLRTNCSSLNFTLYNKSMVNFPLCTCGSTKTVEHFFLSCPNYSQIRHILLDILYCLPELNVNVLLFGNTYLTHEMNIDIVDAVQTYIKLSKRFEM